jgi:hypothetical protein
MLAGLHDLQVSRAQHLDGQSQQLVPFRGDLYIGFTIPR